MKDDILPVNLADWRSFLELISNTYSENEQERYLIERTIEISSNEFSQFTERLETAQQIAHLGYFTYDIKEDSLILSNGLYCLFGFDKQDHIISKEKFLEFVHEEDRAYLNELINSVHGEKIRTEKEIRIYNPKDKYRWFNFIGILSDHHNLQTSSFFGIAMDINERKLTEKKVTELNQELINTARLAGMADVAISVLHNVGNTLNSASVALELIYETVAKSNYNKLSLIVNLLKEKESDLGNYLQKDEKGKLIPSYLHTLNEVLVNEHNLIKYEIDNIAHSLRHTKEIIAAHQTISKVSTKKEKIILQETIEGTLKISGVFLKRKDIVIQKEFEDLSYIYADKTKLTQILVNLFQNAQESLDFIKQKNKIIKLSIKKDQTYLFIEVEDNGTGISPENLKKLFTFGFTTKDKGHGFGLHSSILAAREMGGNLVAESKGEGKGAKFILSLPLSV